MSKGVEAMIRQIVGPTVSDVDLGIQRLTRYLSVKLTRHEAERLAAQVEEEKHARAVIPPLYRIWRNAKKVALLDKSIHAIQASPAHQAYGAKGQGVQWAVLDSGCTRHPHLPEKTVISARWDCTLATDKPVKEGTKVHGEIANTNDQFGHGTHVAGIIAGEHALPGGRSLSGIAPKARLHIYKVLDAQGEGDDAWIIKALDHIASINEQAGGPEIAGVNLSLGGPFEQGMFGCGHTPLCDELRRLWRQGVVVVLAAGNEGFRELNTSDGPVGTSMPYSIGDPANLDEAIAVGAVHKEKPHLYGVSHFSSRGPTADGRNKPDCVAPGEQILSCRHNPPKGGTSMTDLYYKLDGTSMAAPHISGIIACFLSMRREFIGYPDRVKRILLESCTDLGRHPSLQGAGMPNLVKMLVQT
jgi:subtilisin family serine protease